MIHSDSPGASRKVATALLSVALGSALIASTLAHTGDGGAPLPLVNRTAQALTTLDALAPPTASQP